MLVTCALAAALSLAASPFPTARQATTLDWQRTVAYSPNGKALASAGDDEKIHIWNPATGARLRSWKAHRSHVTRIAYVLGGKQLASVGADGTLALWDPGTGRLVRRVSTGTSYVADLSTNKAGTRIATAGYDNRAKLWNAANGRLIRSFPVMPSDALAVALSPDGKWLAVGSGTSGTRPGRSLAVFSTATGARKWFRLGGQCSALAFDHAAKRLAADVSMGQVTLLDAATGKQLESKAKTWNGNALNTFAFNGDGTLLATGGYDNRITVWTNFEGDSPMELQGHTEAVYGLAFDPSGVFLASASFDGTVRIWDLSKSEAVHTMRAKS
jgi:WD40 repeat protein